MCDLCKNSPVLIADLDMTLTFSPPPRFRNLQKVNRPVALETFEKYKDFYHPICRGMVEKDLFGKKDN